MLGTINENNNKRLNGKAKAIQYEIQASGCWHCVSHAPQGAGYARLYRQGRYWNVHQYVYYINHGAVSDYTTVIRHTCDNPVCINPTHLVIGTQGDNMRDAYARQRRTKQGESNHNARLTDEQVVEIFYTKEHYKTVCKRYGIGNSLFYDIRNRKAWVHITAGL